MIVICRNLSTLHVLTFLADNRCKYKMWKKYMETPGVELSQLYPWKNKIKCVFPPGLEHPNPWLKVCHSPDWAMPSALSCTYQMVYLPSCLTFLSSVYTTLKMMLQRHWNYIEITLDYLFNVFAT